MSKTEEYLAELHFLLQCHYHGTLDLQHLAEEIYKLSEKYL